jgi:GT2 family glycosyltransferase
VTGRAPLVSVIIPTHNRRTSLQRTLDAFRTQSLDSVEFEVLVVADGCTDDTLEFVGGYESPYRLTIQEQPGQGAAVARNHGAEMATGHLILFIDDDVEPSSVLLENHVSLHREGPGQVVLGPYYPATRGKAAFHRIIVRRWWEEKFSEMARDSHRYYYRDFLTGNASLERERFNELGGFDNEFRGCGAEDWELGARLLKAGLQFRFAPEAVGTHYEHETTDLHRLFSRARQEGRGETIIGRRHPELRSTLRLSRYSHPLKWFETCLVSLIFNARSIGDWLANIVERILPILEWARLRRAWLQAFGAIHQYWFLRGAAEKFENRQEFKRFVCDGATPERYPGPQIQIDLLDGLRSAETLVEEARPVAITVRYGALEVIRIAPVPGSERLRGIHLRPLLFQHLRNSPFPGLLSPRIPNLPSGSFVVENPRATFQNPLDLSGRSTP